MPDYEMILNSSLNYIERNLYRSFSLEDVADYAGYSMYHYLRVFQTFTGYTLKNYVRERRLSEAAKELINTEAKIKNLAGKYGFMTSETFMRAFRKHFGIVPSQYRKRNQLMNYTPKLKLQICLKNYGGKKVDYKIKKMAGMNIIGLKRKVRHGDDSIEKMWNEYRQICNKNNIKTEKTISVCPHDPRFVDKQPESDDQFIYLIGHEELKETSLPNGFERYSIKPAMYAVFYHNVKDSMAETYKYISCDWIQNVDYEWALGDELEIRKNSEIVEIYIPVLEK